MYARRRQLSKSSQWHIAPRRIFLGIFGAFCLPAVINGQMIHKFRLWRRRQILPFCALAFILSAPEERCKIESVVNKIRSFYSRKTKCPFFISDEKLLCCDNKLDLIQNISPSPRVLPNLLHAMSAAAWQINVRDFCPLHLGLGPRKKAELSLFCRRGVHRTFLTFMTCLPFVWWCTRVYTLISFPIYL